MKYSLFHLDGPGALKHLDSLLELDALDGIQWVSGAEHNRFLSARRQGSYQPQRLPQFGHISGILNQLHGNETRNGRKVGPARKPSQRRRMSPLHVDPHVGIQEDHRLRPVPSFCSPPQSTGVLLTVPIPRREA
jgi:hypothetical protein